MISYPKRLIEVDLPIKQISEHSRIEKSIGQISTLHYWWARRPLAACRAVLCAALWPDPVDEYCPQSFRDKAARILCDFAEKVRTDPEVLRLSHSHWLRWQRTTPTSLKADLPQFWPDMRYALLDFIADFSNRQAAINPTFSRDGTFSHSNCSRSSRRHSRHATACTGKIHRFTPSLRSEHAIPFTLTILRLAGA